MFADGVQGGHDRCGTGTVDGSIVEARNDSVKSKDKVHAPDLIPT